jgi:hypothetical protein
MFKITLLIGLVQFHKCAVLARPGRKGVVPPPVS